VAPTTNPSETLKKSSLITLSNEINKVLVKIKPDNKVKTQKITEFSEKIKEVPDVDLEKIEKNTEINDLKREISVLKTVIYFQKKEIEELRLKTEKIQDNLTFMSDQKTLSFLKIHDQVEVDSENNQGAFPQKEPFGFKKRDDLNEMSSDLKQGVQEKNETEKILFNSTIINRETRFKKGWFLFIIHLEFQNLKGLDFLTLKKESIFIEGGKNRVFMQSS
jgi:hypothetical protein